MSSPPTQKKPSINIMIPIKMIQSCFDVLYQHYCYRTNLLTVAYGFHISEKEVYCRIAKVERYSTLFLKAFPS